MNVFTTGDFDRAYVKLPDDIQRLYAQQRDRFRMDWRDPRLYIKKVKDLGHAFSFRITRRYRVFFYFTNLDTAIFYDIDHRKNAYR